jgi:hypothetical protein
MAKDFLATHEIQSEVVGARDYAAIVVGTGSGRYELMVEESRYDQAQKLIEPIQKKTRPLELLEPHNEVNLPNYFRRAVFYGLAAIPMLPPILSNYASLVNAHLFWRHSEKMPKDRAKIIFIYLLQIPSFFSLWALYHNFLAGK